MSRRVFPVVTVVLMACGGGTQGPKTAPTRARAPAKAQVTDVAVSAAATHTVRREEVSFLSGGRSIKGTLTVPAGAGRFAAVLLLAGSGPTDRDWNSKLLPGTNGSGKLLAEQLTRHGTVVLRFDKMGTGKTVAPKTVGWDGFLDEAKAALALLRGRAEVDPNRIVVAGHSEGGLHALRLAHVEGKGLRGVMLLSSVGRNYGALMLSQIEASFRTAGGLSGEALENVMKPIKQAFVDFAAGKTVDPTKVGPFPAIQRLVASLVNPASVKLVRPLLAFDPLAATAKLTVPTLVLGGAKDIQVDPQIDGVLLRDAAKKGGVDVTFFVGDEADHVLKNEPRLAVVLLADRGATGRGYNRAGRVLDAGSVAAIVAWLVKYTAGPGNSAK